MMTEVVVGGYTYLVGKLSAFDQLKVAKRIAPLAAEILAFYAAADMKPSADGSLPSIPGDLVTEMFRRLAMGLTCLSDEDCDVVTKICLSAVRRQTENGVAAVLVNGQIFPSDMDLGTLITLTVEVIKENLKGFTFALPLM